MTEVTSLIEALGLAPHPEGGHYRRTWTAPAQVDTPRGRRHSASAILFLLECDEEARWHLVHSDELWIWSGPGTLEVHLGGSGEAPSAEAQIVTLGPAGSGAPSDSSNPVQILVPAGSWQRTFARGSYALATCVVSPEFSFDDWELADTNGGLQE